MSVDSPISFGYLFCNPIKSFDNHPMKRLVPFVSLTALIRVSSFPTPSIQSSPSLLALYSSKKEIINGEKPRIRSKVLKGNPSFPGWNTEQLSKLTDWAVSDAPNRPIICEYEPDAHWLWTRWRGTVLR